MTIIINKDRALELLEIVVEGKEDFVYKAGERVEINGIPVGLDCVYVDDEGCPSCFIAHALHEAGVTDEQLKALDNPDPDLYKGSTSIHDVPLPAGLVLTEGARTVFATAQGSQDFGKPWGVCLDEAITTHRSLDIP